MKDYRDTLTYADERLAKPPFRREQPSDQAIAKAFWAKSHCQTHTAAECAFVEDIVQVASEIDAGTYNPTEDEDKSDLCTLGMGCEAASVCYASAHGAPDQCGKP